MDKTDILPHLIINFNLVNLRKTLKGLEKKLQNDFDPFRLWSSTNYRNMIATYIFLSCICRIYVLHLPFDRNALTRALLLENCM